MRTDSDVTPPAAKSVPAIFDALCQRLPPDRLFQRRLGAPSRSSFGLSTICLAAALRDNGGGRRSELEPDKIAHARANLQAAALADLVEIRDGAALESLARDLPETIDFVLLDGHKPLYSKILDYVAPRLRAGACIVADNADACPDYLARVHAANGGYVSVPFGDDVELTTKL